MKRFVVLILVCLLASSSVAIERNTPSQKVYVTAVDTSTNALKTGDATNITAYVSIDGGALTPLTDTSATEVSSTNAPGTYEFDLTQAETNGISLLFTAKSTTANVAVVPRFIATTLHNLPILSAVNWGDHQDDDQIQNFQFSTPGTLTGATIVLYKDGSTDEITTATTLTPNFDGIVGLNNLAVNFADTNITIGTFEAVLTAGTVNGASVAGQSPGSFSVERYADDEAVAQAVLTAIDARLMSIDAVLNANTFFGSALPVEAWIDFATEGYSSDENKIVGIADNGILSSTFDPTTGLAPITSATAQAGTTTSITLAAASSSAVSEFYRYRKIYLVSGTGLGQASTITGYDGTTKVATVSPAWVVAPDATTVYVILPGGP